MRPCAELVSTGTELLSGRVANTHAQDLGRYLAECGLSLSRDTTVPDDPAAIEGAVCGALDRVDVVFVSGGLGPTPDDITRDALARALGRRVVTDGPALEVIRRRYESRGRTFTDAAARQALVVEGAVVLSNPVGIAPGERLDLDGKSLFVLPGPPREFRAVIEAHILSWLKREFSDVTAPPSRLFLLAGRGESDLVTEMDQLGIPPEGVEARFCARPACLEVCLVADSAGHVAEALVERAAVAFQNLVGADAFAEEPMAMEEVVGRLLKGAGRRVAVAESCTGGLLGHRLTSVSGSSSYFAGGVIAYDNAVKTEWLGVAPAVLEREGAVSEPVAALMAGAVRERFAVDYGLGITGVAGPTGGTDGKPVGLVFIGLASASGVVVRQFQFSGDRSNVKFHSSQRALDMLRRKLLSSD